MREDYKKENTVVDSVPEIPTVMILGLLQRCGTNFIYDLVRAHPDVRVGKRIYEDFSLHCSHHLIRYASDLYQRWDPAWEVGREKKDDLLEEIGGGILRFLSANAPGKGILLLKSPSVRHIENLPHLFPGVRTVVLVRDGRDVVASGMRTFGWEFEEGAENYNIAAQTFIQFNRQEQEANPVMMIRYEDLYKDMQLILIETLNFFQLHLESYDFHSARNLPVRGSSRQGAVNGEVMDYWSPNPKPEDFNPIGRWKHWSQRKKERFIEIAGESLHQLGYALS